MGYRRLEGGYLTGWLKLGDSRYLILCIFWSLLLLCPYLIKAPDYVDNRQLFDIS